MRLLEGKAAIITGSSRGIGRAISKAFEESLKPIADELGCFYAAGDIGEFETSQRLAGECMNSFGRVDIFVNNAGIGIS